MVILVSGRPYSRHYPAVLSRMSVKKGRTKTRVHFEPSSLLPGAGSSKPKPVKGASKQANKLLDKSRAPGQLTKLLTPADAHVVRMAEGQDYGLQRAPGIVELGNSSEKDWDLIWAKMSCIECFNDGKEESESERSIFFRGYWHTLQDQDTT